MQDYEDDYYLEEDKMGMTVTSGSVVIKKDTGNLIGISIGGGAPLCPCLYIVQVFDNTPAAREGTLQSGDELVAVNGATVKGRTKVEVAKMIQGAQEEVSINYNKLHADEKQGKTLDIVLKKVKHRLVEGMSSSTADALGLSRAILCNDSLVKRLQQLQATEAWYKQLVEQSHRMLRSFYELLQTVKAFGDAFAAVGVREPQPRASETFTRFGDAHRQMERDGVAMIKAVKPVISDFGTYLHKAIPDTKMTVRRYADAKFSYLSYCLKVKEMDDEEHSYAALQEPLYRVETGNYEYRLILRCRQEARVRFARLRSDVLEKIELLESKHARDVAEQLRRFVRGLARYSDTTAERFRELGHPFPVEVDLPPEAFRYKANAAALSAMQDDEENQKSTADNDEDAAEQAQEATTDSADMLLGDGPDVHEEDLLPELRDIQLTQQQQQYADIMSISQQQLMDGDNKMAAASVTTGDLFTGRHDNGADDDGSFFNIELPPPPQLPQPPPTALEHNDKEEVPTDSLIEGFDFGG